MASLNAQYWTDKGATYVVLAYRGDHKPDGATAHYGDQLR
jgi:hypothetical protein